MINISTCNQTSEGGLQGAQGITVRTSLSKIHTKQKKYDVAWEYTCLKHTSLFQNTTGNEEDGEKCHV